MLNTKCYREGFPFQDPRRHAATTRRICRQDEAQMGSKWKFEKVCKLCWKKTVYYEILHIN